MTTPETSEASPVSSASPQERTRHLLEQMPARRPVLLSVLDFCSEPRAQADVTAHIEAKQAQNRSVFSPASLCSLLEDAGTLAKVTESGETYSDSAPEPQVVVVDGVEYLEPRPAPVLYWQTTAAGRAALEGDDPAARLNAMLAQDAAYLAIYERVLTLCDADGGASTAELGRAVDHDPILQQPRYFAQRFIERLESCGALAWDGSWRTTGLGTQALEALASGAMSVAR